MGGDEEKKAETEALQEARQLAQMRVALKIFMRTVTLFCVGGTAFLIVRESKITTRVGGAKPRWGVVCSLFFGGRMILNWLMDLVMMALDRKHVVAKRISFIIGGIYDQLVSTMYYITLRVTWGLLLRATASREWSECTSSLARLASLLHRARGDTHVQQGRGEVHGGLLPARGVLQPDRQGARGGVRRRHPARDVLRGHAAVAPGPRPGPRRSKRRIERFARVSLVADVAER